MKKKYLRYIIYIVEIYILCSLEQVGVISIFGVNPLLVLPAFVSISLFEEKYFAAFFGFISGFLIDLSFNNILGLNACLLGVCGLILGNLFYYFLRPNFLASMFISGFLSCVLLGVNILVNFVLKGFSGVGIVAREYIKIVFLTVFVSLMTYFFNRSVSYLTREIKNGK